MTRRLWLLLVTAQLAGLAAIFGGDALLSGMAGPSPAPQSLSGLFVPREGSAVAAAAQRQGVVIHFSFARCAEGCAGGAKLSITVHRRDERA